MADNYEYERCKINTYAKSPVYVDDGGTNKIVYVNDNGTNKIVYRPPALKTRYEYEKCVLTAPDQKTRYEYAKCSL